MVQLMDLFLMFKENKRNDFVKNDAWKRRRSKIEIKYNSYSSLLEREREIDWKMKGMKKKEEGNQFSRY